MQMINSTVFLFAMAAILVDSVTEAAPGLMKAGLRGCVITGCSRELCVDVAKVAKNDHPLVSVCLYKSYNNCYLQDFAVCSRDMKNGKCGWQPSSALTACLKYNQAPKTLWLGKSLLSYYNYILNYIVSFSSFRILCIFIMTYLPLCF